VAARKDRSKRLEYFAHSNEYCQIAQAIEPSNAMALNHMANHCFHTWKAVSHSHSHTVVSPFEIAIERSEAEDLSAGDPLRTSSSSYSIASIVPRPAGGATSALQDKVVLVLEGKEPLRNDYESIEVREFGKVVKLAKRAFDESTVAAIRAESLYIIGRVAHAQLNLTSALDYYKRALIQNSDFSIAAFGAAQILLSQHDLAASLEGFEKIHLKHPDDRDTQAYVMLLRALVKKESSGLEKVREVAPGFTHEVDLWLLQGTLRQTNPAEYSSALRCYSQALECLEQRGAPPDPRLLTNMAVLHHGLGRPSQALQLCRRALKAQQQLNEAAPARDGDALNINPVFRSPDFEGIFYSWSSSSFLVQPDWSAAEWTDGHAEEATSEGDANTAPKTASMKHQLCSFMVIDSGDGSVETDVASLVGVGDEVLVTLSQINGERVTDSPVIHHVVSVTTSTITTRSPIHKVLLQIAAKSRSASHDAGSDEKAALRLTIHRKVPGTNFTDETTTLCYNLARILEDLGRTKAASEVYIQLLKQHPSFLDCKITE
jgi:tetratricopeptide (TPR) repeat protein